jgi:hypothetical protein
MNLFVDITHLTGMMIGMSECPSHIVDRRKALATESCLNSARGSIPSLEVLVNKALTIVVAAALVAALFVGAVVTAKYRMQDGRGKYQQGMMPEVVVEAEMPRLVMPTVQVRAFRALAMTGSILNVN